MPLQPKQKRLQFSSCDACRRSRVACDASKRNHQPLGRAGSCSRCSRKSRTCTFEWVENAKMLLDAPQDTERRFITYKPSEKKLFSQLDGGIDERSTGTAEYPERQLDQHLESAIHAFAAHWLPLLWQYRHLSINQVQTISRDRWRAARRDMLKLINRISYQSMLALYIFAQTPIPVGISEDEELDGMNGQVCMQTALYQLQRLRERRSAYSGEPFPSAISNGSAAVTSQFVDLESRVYWAAMMWDTSSSLASGTRTSLTSGLKGACAEPTWRLVRAFLVGSFKSRTQHWHDEGFQVTDDIAYEIISAASICKTYIWKIITSLKEALREGVHDDGVTFAWTSLIDTIEIFNTTVRPLLNSCEKRLLFLDQRVRLSWYSLQLQYYLGVLLLADVLEAAQRTDLLPTIENAVQEAEHESFIVLKFGLGNKYTVHGPRFDDGEPQLLISAPLVAIDPYPQHVLDLVLLMYKRLDWRLGNGSITQETHSCLLATLAEVLQALPQSSKAVHDAGKVLNSARI
ncbi:hypothetical protein CC86DRAFT_446299 [Ophiobolus disseminans]|uniref:Zn(2)-C6 fungal-type domain-containing protein n=1 Tax=Ophiobolus disseminans TaxID=1469910 RepID=A0A6A6ZYP3_9PLEO|nr:hypothetical protein CC86DRAFT_446299 [Ophiobolus disseminans]